MPAKKTSAKKTKGMIKTSKKKPSAKKKAKPKKGDVYECGVCGYRMIVDEVCGCAEEHVFVCCDKPMTRK